MYQVTDHVVYGNYGICVVKAIGKLEMDSAAKDRLYYTLEPLYSEKNTIYTPVDKKDATMRCAITEQEAWNLIDGIQGQEMIQVADEKRAEHEYREIMKTNECTGWSRIIKTIYLKNRKRLEGGKRYTAKDDVYLRLAEDFLYRELAAALNVNREDVESIISDRVKQLS